MYIDHAGCAAEAFVGRVRNGTLYERLTALTDSGQIVRGPEGYRLATQV
jgi:hypothetical protein